MNFQAEDSPLQIKILLVEEDGAYVHAHSTKSASSLLFGELYLILDTLLIAVFRI